MSSEAQKRFIISTTREYSDGSSDAYVPYVVENSDIKFYGLSTKFLYRSSKDQTVNLKGEGFDAGEEITVKIMEA